MGRFDRYLLAVFGRHLLVIGGAVLGTFLLLDLLGNSDEFAQVEAPSAAVAADVARYLALKLPAVWLEFAPYLTLLAGLTTALHLARQREWIPVLGAGRSALRAVLPLLLAALALGAGTAGIRETVQPRLAPLRMALEWRLEDQRPWQMRQLLARGRDGTRLLAGVFRPAAGEIEDFEAYGRGPGGEDVLVLADRARWDGGGWVLAGGRRVVPGRETRPAERFEAEGLAPADLLRAAFARVAPLELSSAQLREVLARDPGHRQAATLIWAWRAAPLAHLVLLLLGLPFVLRFDRRSAVEGLGLGLLLGLLYFVAEIVLRDLAGRGALPPFWGGAGALLLFGAWAVLGWRPPGTARRSG
ncbi:MAG: LptF/LptG family permease [Planctomycetota bacterium]|nr:MAG: LptF/LptG family permease [Planctomycetota bacterium]